MVIKFYLVKFGVLSGSPAISQEPLYRISQNVAGTFIYIINTGNSSVCLSVCVCVTYLLLDRWVDFFHISAIVATYIRK